MQNWNKFIEKTENEYSNILHLTANENVLSPIALRAYQSSLYSRYDMGEGSDGVIIHGGFAAKGMPETRDLLNAAVGAAKKMLSAEVVELNCLSGVHAMLSSLLSTTRPSDTVMSVLSRHGGHFATKPIIEASGRKQIYAEYDFEHQCFDVEKTAKIFHENHAKALYLDVSVYLKPHPIKELRKALGEDAIIIYDASHTMGLIMAGEFQSPLTEGADVISANTHKTLPGPHRGMIAFKNVKLWEKATPIITNLYSTVHTNSLLALAITILEMEKYGKSYAKQIIKNSNSLAEALVDLNLPVRRADNKQYSYNHQVHMFTDMDNQEIVRLFLNNNISINTSRALGEQIFIRFGTQEITHRGMKEPDMKDLAVLIKGVLDRQNMLEKVTEFNRKFKEVNYGFKTI